LATNNKFLLINPRPLEFELLEAIGIPFNILYLGTWLKHHGFDVEIIDGLVQPSTRVFYDRVMEGARDAAVVGVSVMTPHVADSLELSKKIKEKYPRCAVLWGGIHPTLFPDSTLKHPAIDFVIYGEGEDAILHLARELQKEHPNFAAVPGMGFKLPDGKFKMTQFRTTVEVNKLPDPDYSLLEPFDPYLIPRNLSRKKSHREMYRYASIHCGRGCPYDCTFCINTVYDQPLLRRHRAFPAERTFAEMKWFKEKHGVQYISLQDELFFVNRPRLEKLVDLMEKEPLGVIWDTNVRVNYFNEAYVDRKFLTRIYDLGYRKFNLSVESGSDRVIKALHKNILREQALQTVQNVAEAGMTPTAGFMIGIPGEEVEDMYKTLKLAIELYTSVNGKMSFIGPQTFRPYPGAELFETARKMGLKTPANLEDWATIAVNPMFGFLDMRFLPWLDDNKRRHINFIQKYFTVVLGCRLDWSVLKLPLRMMLVSVPLHLLLKLRVRFGVLDRFWLIERTILNTLTPAEAVLRKLRVQYRKIKHRMRDLFSHRPVVKKPVLAAARG